MPAVCQLTIVFRELPQLFGNRPVQARFGEAIATCPVRSKLFGSGHEVPRIVDARPQSRNDDDGITDPNCRPDLLTARWGDRARRVRWGTQPASEHAW